MNGGGGALKPRKTRRDAALLLTLSRQALNKLKVTPVAEPELILIVDDDPNLREIVRFALDKEGYPSVQAADGQKALEGFRAHKPALIILDVMMPEMNGTEVCREIRKHSDVPIIFLSSRDEELDRILGLELGGDDYLTKPFSPRELVARVKAISRRVRALKALTLINAMAPGSLSGIGAAEALLASRPVKPGDGEELTLGRLTLDLLGCRALFNGQAVVLTATEFGLLRALMRHPKKVYSRDELVDKAYADAVVEARTIDSHVKRLRKKFAAHGIDPIETVAGFGYKMATAL